MLEYLKEGEWEGKNSKVCRGEVYGQELVETLID